MAIKASATDDSIPLKLRFSRFEIDEAEARLLDNGKPLRLAPKPFAVLCALARTPQALVSKSALLDRVWGHQHVSESGLKTMIGEVRAALGDDARQPRYVETVSCRGYRFIGAVTGRSATPPSPLEPAPTPAVRALVGHPAVGRAGELDSLHAAWRVASGGRRQVVWITGDAGVGKTTLIERFISEVGDAACCHGHCVSNVAQSEPGLPVLEALTGLCRRTPSTVELLRQVAPTWLSRMPWLSTPTEREALQREMGDTGPGRMLREMGELLDRCSARDPLLLVTEDLQWADEFTVQLIDYIARRRTGARVMWLASFRLTELIAAEHPLAAVRQELRLHGLAQEIVLDAFSPAEVSEYLAACLPAWTGDRELVNAVYQRTDGLPLFLANLLDQVGAPVSADGPASVRRRLEALQVPDSLAGIVERYLEELTPRQRSILEAASVCGRQFRVTTLADVLGEDIPVLADECAVLERRQRWLKRAPEGSPELSFDVAYVFRHALYREVLQRRLDPGARIDLHRRVKASLNRDGARPRSVASIADIQGAASTGGRAGLQRRSALPMPA